MASKHASSRVFRGKRALLWPVPVLALSLAGAGLHGAYTSHAEPAMFASGAPASGAAARSAATACVDKVYGSMSSAQRVGQLFMGGVNASKPDQKRIDVLRQYHVGSVFLAGRSSAGTKATKSLVDGLQAKADTVSKHRVGLLVSTDQEGGQVQVLSGPGFSTMPSAVTQGTWSASKLRDEATAWAKQLKSAGVNLNLAPVADVVPASLGRNNAPIGRYDREYGHTAAAVTPHSDAFAAGFAQAGVLATLKHFPGLGNVRGNTDTTANVVDSVTTTKSSSLTPFSSGIKAGAPFVMISLATYSKIDSKHQAVFSSTVIQQLLRKDLGFKGVVISDDLGNAVAVKSIAPGTRAVNFIAAGGDLALTVEPNLIPAMTKAVQTRMTQSATFRSQVDQSVHRVLAAKQREGLLTCS
ncbi:glycoside hydrolase family 3 protein [Streptomyces sp. J2-1]|uniref:glycoside hydrolase family 3 N-terminal domain-containing protein n=1 Tax=Streptomyces corallincola TaxID=2851888 RepID=UPI001C394CA4|nr:glycoside hydrolase family 3 N-terminal domain-containing protein [Streptomyces corallincola]MBV2352806.1 glycoside hydrolase family 3 protein [Streptomyces corallincola]